MRHIFYDSLKRFFVVCALTIVGIFSATAANLPAGYTELEYIDTDGDSWIDTGIAPTATTLRFDYKMQILQKEYVSLFGAVAATNPRDGYRNFYQPTMGENQIQHQSGSYYGPQNFTWDAVLQGTVVINNGVSIVSTINGSTTTLTSSSINLTQSGTIFLGTTRLGTGTSGRAPTRTWFLKITKDGTVVFDGVPAKNSSGVIGIYDLADSNPATAFHTNAGTGTFTAGPTACNGTRVNYTTATGTVTQSGTPTPTNPIAPVFYTQGDMVLRKVGDYADSYDATTGKITRRVGVKVLDGTENWFYTKPNGEPYLGQMYNLEINDMFAELSSVTVNRQSPYCTHFARSTSWISTGNSRLNKVQGWLPRADSTPILGLGYSNVSDANIPTFKAWLAEQYANGTPVTVYYPLATAVEEDWPAEQCIVSDGIKIATTKYTEDAFAGLMTTLSEAITKVTNIVDTTVQQATEIGNLATTKQDRPDTDCPAGRKCLLIMGADNKPHWYLIQE